MENPFQANLTNNAEDKIIEFVKNYPNQITFISLGPLTNLARAINKNPSVMKNLKQVLIMGGAINVRGNQTRFAEFNFFNDPESAKIVFSFPINKILLPLDVCNKIQMQIRDFKKIKKPEIKDFILKIMKEYIDLTKKEEGFSGALMYDPLTIYYLIKPLLCNVKKYRLDVEVKGVKRGRIKKNKSGFEVNVIEDIGKDFFKKDLIEILSMSQEETLLNNFGLNFLDSSEE